MSDRTAGDGATSELGMDTARDNFAAGRGDMIDAFAELTALARRAGVDHDHITALHGRFFDGNVAIRRAFKVALLFAETRIDHPGCG